MRHLYFLLLFAFVLHCSCSQRDTGHLYGDMSNDPRLEAIHQTYSAFRPETHKKAYKMVKEIDPQNLSVRDYYEWLELKCNIAHSMSKEISWINEIRQWVEYANTKGSDRDILTAHQWLSVAYKFQKYHHPITNKQQSDSIENLILQELLFCINYLEKPDYPAGDYKYQLAKCYSNLADCFFTFESSALQSSQYKEMAADLVWEAIQEKDSHLTRFDMPHWYVTLLREAAIGYRECGDYQKARACIDRCLDYVRKENNPADIYRCLGVKGSIEVWGRLADKMADYYKELDPDDTWIPDNFRYYDEGIQYFSHQDTLATELFYYKAMAYLSCEKYDSAMYYVDKFHTPFTVHYDTTLPDGTVKNQKKTIFASDAIRIASENPAKAYLFSKYIQAIHAHMHGNKEEAYELFKQLTFEKFKHGNFAVFHFFPTAEKVAKYNIQELKERQRIQFHHTLIQVFCLLLVLILILSLYVYFHNRTMRQLNASISQLNRQLDELRAEKLQKQVTIESENEIPAPDDAMESIFIDKLRLKHTAFQSSSHYRLLSQLKLRYASSSNPVSSRVTAEERHSLMDAILSEFALECQQLQELYPALTGTDSVYCILSLLDFSREVGAACMEVGEEAYRRRKSRIKQKVSEALFSCIFGKE